MKNTLKSCSDLHDGFTPNGILQALCYVMTSWMYINEEISLEYIDINWIRYAS